MEEQKTNKLWYIIAIIIGFAALVFITGIFTLSYQWGMNKFLFAFIISLCSLIAGGIAAVIINKITKSNKAFILGAAIISFLTAAFISISLSVQNTLNEQAKAMITKTYAGGFVFFENSANPILTGILIIIFFNLPFLVIFLRKEQKSAKDLLIYLYSLIIFFILYFLVPIIGLNFYKF